MPKGEALTYVYVYDEHGALETGLAADDREISDRSNAHGDAQEGGVDILASPATCIFCFSREHFTGDVRIGDTFQSV